MKADEQRSFVLLFFILFKVALTFESVDEIQVTATVLKQYFPIVLVILYKVDEIL